MALSSHHLGGERISFLAFLINRILMFSHIIFEFQQQQQQLQDELHNIYILFQKFINFTNTFLYMQISNNQI